MQRKTNDRLLWIAVVIIAFSLVLQTFGIKEMTKTQTYKEDYSKDSFIYADHLTDKRTPVPKEVLDKKFAEYKLVSDDGKTMNLFTEYQYRYAVQMRRQGHRERLSLDEVLYIIEDSIDLYFAYDRVMFTGCIDPWTLSSSFFSDHRYVSVYFPKNPDNFYSFEDYYGYVVRDISKIVWFRLMVHDSGFVGIYDNGNLSSGNMEIKHLLDYPYLGSANYHYSVVLRDHDVDDFYKNELATTFYNYWVNLRGKDIEEADDFDSINIRSAALSLAFGSGEIVMWDVHTLDAVKLFPTTSLEARIREALAGSKF